MADPRGLQTADYERRLLAEAIASPLSIRMDRIEIAARHLPTITQLLADYDVWRAAHATAEARAAELREALEACVVAMDEWGANEEGIAVDAWDAYEVARDVLGVPVVTLNPEEAADGGDARYLRYLAALAARGEEATRG